MSNINDTFFDGYYKDIWRSIIPEILTTREVDFIIQYFDLQPNYKVLDIMCGYGRHATGLARKGMNVTAIDNLADYISEIKEIAQKENLLLNAIQSDVINYKADADFDLALCMGNSLNFFNAEDTLSIIKAVANNLKTGGKFLINSWSLAEIVSRNFKEENESLIGNMKFLTKSKYLYNPTRIETQSTILASDGSVEIKTGVDYIFTTAEIEAMLNKAGFTVKEIYSIPGKKIFTEGDPRIYIIAEKK
jgi:2-polyprenyl-3-methyl-5-hydroxy-6-metoxy-1,4-benzoquinol methylase